jgi:hypothetical protein
LTGIYGDETISHVMDCDFTNDVCHENTMLGDRIVSEMVYHFEEIKDNIVLVPYNQNRRKSNQRKQHKTKEGDYYQTLYWVFMVLEGRICQ